MCKNFGGRPCAKRDCSPDLLETDEFLIHGRGKAVSDMDYALLEEKHYHLINGGFQRGDAWKLRTQFVRRAN